MAKKSKLPGGLDSLSMGTLNTPMAKTNFVTGKKGKKKKTVAKRKAKKTPTLPKAPESMGFWKG